MFGTHESYEKPLILMYHRIAGVSESERYNVSPAQFSKQMKYLAERNYHVISLATLVDGIAGIRTISGRSVVLTFDDGFLDTYEHARPVLLDYQFPAMFFVITDLVGKTNSWMITKGYPESRLMNWREVESLRHDGFEIGSHTATHRDLSTINLSEAKKEVEDSKRILEACLGIPVNFFAYPYGRGGDMARQLVQDAGYRAACATAPGFVTYSTDHYRLCRIEVTGWDSMGLFIRKLKFGFNSFSYFDLLRYYAGRIKARTLGD